MDTFVCVYKIQKYANLEYSSTSKCFEQSQISVANVIAWIISLCMPFVSHNMQREVTKYMFGFSLCCSGVLTRPYKGNLLSASFKEAKYFGFV